MTVTPAKGNYGSLGANIDGAIAAANSLISRQGFGIKDYPSNMGGLVAAILSLNIAQSHIGITPPQWMPVYDDDGHIIGDTWEPPPDNGTLWFDTRQGRLMVWVNDGFYQANGGDGLTVVTNQPPENPLTGQSWYNTDIGAYFLWNGIQWIEINGGSGSTSALSDEVNLLRNTVDELSARRSSSREYEIFNEFDLPEASSDGQVATSDLSNTSGFINIAISSHDKNGLVSIPGTAGDIIDIESDDGSINRYTIIDVQPTYYQAQLSSGSNTYEIGDEIKVFIYPQNDDYATISYTNEQLQILQTELDQKHQFFYEYSAPTDTVVNNGDLWYDRLNLRLLVRDQDTWINPDRVSTEGTNKIFHQTTIPTGSDVENGDIWFDTTEFRMYFYSNGAWINPDRR